MPLIIAETITIVQTRPHTLLAFRWRSLSVRESLSVPSLRDAMRTAIVFLI
jgi:hypothetical protein